MENSLQTARANDETYLKVANRPDMMMVLANEPDVQIPNNAGMVLDESSAEYAAPVYTLDDQIVGVLPEIIVRLIDEADFDKLTVLCAQLSCTIEKSLLYTEREFLIRAQAQTGEEVLMLAELLSSSGFVEWAFPNLAFQPRVYSQPETGEPGRVEPNDVYFNRQWHLDAVRAPEAWAYTAGDPNIIVAVLDDGVDIDHPDLADNIWTNPNEIPDNGIDDDNNGLVDDVHGWSFADNYKNVKPTLPGDAHGTACAGLIAARAENNLGVAGVAWNCTLMPVCILHTAFAITNVQVADAIRYAAVSGADVLSNSWGATVGLPAIQSAIQDVTAPGGIGRHGKGCIVFFSSGNWQKGGEVIYPAKYPEALAIGAIDQNDVVWYYSGSGSELDFVAPSGDAGLEGDIWTTDTTGSDGFNNRNTDILDYTDKMGGTSGACPIAAGIAALVLSADPNLTLSEVEGILWNSARDLGSPGWDSSYGFGCLDAYTAVSRTMSPRRFNLFVDDDAPNDPGPGDSDVSDPLEDGSSEHPFDSIKEAVDIAVHMDAVVVLPGTYTGQGNCNIDFGGKMITVRSQGGPEGCVIDCQSEERAFYLHRKEGPHSRIEGFTITNGQAIVGGAIYINDSNPTVTNCIFAGNAANQGGAMFVKDSSANVDNCSFISNSTQEEGGAMYNYHSAATISSCTFAQNISGSNGGAVYNLRGTQAFNNCIFTENSSGKSGGGMYNLENILHIEECSFAGNSAETYGGGFYASNLSPRLSNSTFTNNSAGTSGGAIYTLQCDSILNNCAFRQNSCIWYGGAMYTRSGNPVLTDCTFTENSSDDSGGALYINSDNVSLLYCTFDKNTSRNGAGMYNYKTPATLKYCKFAENSAQSYGGGISSYDSHTLAVYYSVFVRNLATAQSGALYGYVGVNRIQNCTFFGNSGGFCQQSSEGNRHSGGSVTNSILWNNGQDLTGWISVYYSHVQGGWIDEKHHIESPPSDIDPLFADPENDDFHLKSQAGRWDPVDRIWVQDEVTSPDIDAGDPGSSMAGELWPHGKRINLGAYGSTAQASLSLSQIGDLRDLNSNDWVDWEDVLLLADKWDCNDAPLKEDLDRNGIVDANDLSYFYGNWTEESDNAVPVLDFVENLNVTAGDLLVFSVTASDSDDDELVYLAAGLPEGAEFSDQVFSWTPRQAGTYFITFMVCDKNSLDYATIQVIVE